MAMTKTAHREEEVLHGHLGLVPRVPRAVRVLNGRAPIESRGEGRVADEPEQVQEFEVEGQPHRRPPAVVDDDLFFFSRGWCGGGMGVVLGWMD